MRARSVLESAVITLAAARVTLEADRRFHVAIAKLTGNSLLVRLVGELFDARHGAITSRKSRRAEPARSWETAFEEH